MEHFSHEHPLILIYDPKDDETFLLDHLNVNGLSDRTCDGCGWPISSGPFYRCDQCYWSHHLHKVCAELPREMKHPMHPQHPLSLYSNQPPHPHHCHACKSRCEHFMYYCSPCGFILDIRCASFAHRIEHECHDHPLIPLQQPALFLCDACGIEDKGISYKCSCCPFWVHQTCASLPNTFKHSDHDHLLTLARSLPEEYSTFDIYCDICRELMYVENWAYFCAGCRYFAHTNCATSKRETLEDEETKIEDVLDPNAILFPLPNESIESITHLLQRTSLEEIKVAKMLDCFGHDHQLTLFDEQIDDELCSGSKGRLCVVCVQPITLPFYGCNQCNYFLHKCCAKLPTRIQHPFHTEHLLDLQPKACTELGLNCCVCCFKPCNGFYYKCGQCKGFYLDIKCGSLSGPVKHEAHKHLLTPRAGLRSSSISYCGACDSSLQIDYGFACDKCDFALHTRCAMLPPTSWHRYDEHPFILTCSPIKDHPAEYYCELCEEEVNPKLWFYHCVPCDYSIHTKCMHRYNYLVDLNINHEDIKQGASLKVEGHPHPLTLIGFTKDKYDTEYCEGCDFKYGRISSLFLDQISLPLFECKTCKLRFHPNCVREAVEIKEIKQSIESEEDSGW